MVVEAAETPKGRAATGIFEPGQTARSLADCAQELQRAAVSANEQLGRGNLTKSPEPGPQAALANWLVQNPALFGSGPDAATVRVANEFLAGQSNIASRVRWESHTAVAWFFGMPGRS
jgi:hypothetical protein